LRFEYGVGNIFHYEDIDAAINSHYTIKIDNSYAVRYMGVGPAWGSSKFGVVILEWFDNSFRVLYADSWERPLFDDAINQVITLAQAYSVCKIVTDGANPSVIKTLKKYYGSSEFMNYELLKPEITDKWVYSDCEYNKVVPINFRLKHKELLQKAYKVLSDRRIKIDPKFTKLITSLRTATSKQGQNDTFDLDKLQTTESDVLDAYMLAQLPVQIK
jgi:hypothetical protein